MIYIPLPPSQVSSVDPQLIGLIVAVMLLSVLVVFLWFLGSFLDLFFGE